MDKNSKIMAVAVVAILVVASVAVVAWNNSKNKSDDISDDDGTVTITQNDGTEVKVSVPVQKLCIVNTNAAEFATILGVSDRVVGVSTTMHSTPTESWWSERTDIGTYNEPDAAKILATGATVVIGQCTSMPITNVESLQAQGVTVILLDLYGYSTQCSDLMQFAKLFPDTNASSIAQKYADFFNNIVNSLKEKTSTIADSDRKTFISTMGVKSTSKYYTGSAELSLLLTEVCGLRNAVAEMGVSSSSSTASVDEDSIVKYYNDSGIDLFILRNSSDYSQAHADIESFLDTHSVIKASGMFDNMKVVKTVDSKVLSGPRCFVGMIYFITLMYGDQLDIGITVESAISEYNSLFGTSWTSSELFYEYGS